MGYLHAHDVTLNQVIRSVVFFFLEEWHFEMLATNVR
jgi:hypothetical protein